MSLGSGVTPHWLLGNPYGPLPTDGKYYWMDHNDIRRGPFDTLEEAKEYKRMIWAYCRTDVLGD